MVISGYSGYWLEGITEGDRLKDEELKIITARLSPEEMAEVIDISDNDYVYYKTHFLEQR